MRAESVWVAVAERSCVTPPFVDDPEAVVSGLRCLPVPAGGRTVLPWSGVSATPMLVTSGVCEAWVCWPEPPRFIAETVSPPPTSATAVATTARRWFFLHRSRCRRRAALPSRVATGSSTSASPPTGSGSSYEGAEAAGSRTGSGQAVVAAGAATARPPWVSGAMSGA